MNLVSGGLVSVPKQALREEGSNSGWERPLGSSETGKSTLSFCWVGEKKILAPEADPTQTEEWEGGGRKRGGDPRSKQKGRETPRLG